MQRLNEQVSQVLLLIKKLAYVVSIDFVSWASNYYCFISNKNNIYECLLNTSIMLTVLFALNPLSAQRLYKLNIFLLFRYRNWGLKNSHTFPLPSLILSLFWCLLLASFFYPALQSSCFPNSLVFSPTIVAMENLIYTMLSYKFG